MESFAKTSDDGWRYSLTHRTKKIDGVWIVQVWMGREWDYVGAAYSYAAARSLARLRTCVA
jgi:hypothetical protein